MRRLSRRGREYFELFERAGENAVRAAGLLERLLEEWPDHEELVQEVIACEHEGDRITHEILLRVSTSSAAPFHRGDVHALATGLDDVVDWIEEVAAVFVLYQVEAPMAQAQEQTRILRRACEQVAAALPRLREFEDMRRFTTALDELEDEGDRVVREAIASLFHGGSDPMLVIRWKDIFERLEEAIDATDQVAHVLEGIALRNR
jgi:predicted phosphate transport protein (TIGR00153 family)